ncbi:MAG: hypothetical protein GX780_02765, partial [Campylobacteraceae bacterium]|nr:hypothetical protein [Campylobacteraceae bacterium]
MITLLLPLIGIAIFVFEKRHQKEYLKIILGFLNKIINSYDLSDNDKSSLIRTFLTNNGYFVKQISPVKIRGEKKLFYLSWFFVTYGFYGLYYLWF